MYADDLVLLAPSSMGLSMLLSVCSDYGLEHDIKYNSTKSDILLQKVQKYTYAKLCVKLEILTRVNKCKYLGHVLTEVLSDDDDMARQYMRIYAQGNALIRKKFYMRTECVKCTLFKSYCTSKYTCQLWYNYKSESIRKLFVAYNNVFRLLWNEPRNCSGSYMFVSWGLLTCKMLIRKNVHTLYIVL